MSSSRRPDSGRKLSSGLLPKKTSFFAIPELFDTLAAWMRPAAFGKWGRRLCAMIASTTAVVIVDWRVFDRFC
jgi:hypothetical protein